MKLTSTSTQQSLYRDVLGLTVDEIHKIAIGTPVRVRLHASSGGPSPSSLEQPEDVTTTPCAARTALRIPD